jgi:trimeric autotransporter adhesin
MTRREARRFSPSLDLAAGHSQCRPRRASHFGNQPQGSISPAQVITIFNQGNQPLQLTNLTPAGPDKTQFAVQSTTCGSYSILAGGSCSINIVFTPQGLAAYRAEIDVIDNSGGLTGAKQVIALSGTGVAAAPIASLSPSSLTFGTLAIGSTSGPQAITLRNVGSAALTLSQITFTGTDAAAFGIAASGTTCPTVGGTVAIASNCILQVNFAPQSSGPKNASVNFVDNASGSPQSVLLSGTAIAPKLQVSPTALNFAPQSVGIASASQAMVAAIACGGPNAPTQPPGTPAGTYTLTLTASTTIGSSSGTRTLPLNVTVQ